MPLVFPTPTAPPNAILPPPGSGMELPERNVSMADLLSQNDLPPVDETLPIHPVRAFPWSDREPEGDIAELRLRAVPDMETLLATRRALSQADRSVVRSFLDVRNGRNIPTPLWMIKYWIGQRRAVEMRAVGQRKMDWLRGRLDVAGPDSRLGRAAEEALRSLRALPGDDRMLSNGLCSAAEVLSILGEKYLWRGTVEAMVDRLRQRLTQSPDLERRFVVCPLSTHDLLYIGHRRRDRLTLYAPLHDLVARMKDPQSGLEAVFLPWLTPDEPRRWVLFALDVKRQTIRYGDCLGERPAEEDMVAIEHWLWGEELGWWALGDDLPCAGPDEGISCGVLTMNAIKHAIFQEDLATNETRDAICIEEYLAVVGLEEVMNSEGEAAEGRGVEY
ncbi:hypothetical protein C8Q76DRAFT_688043 [Earliella scabrosa]|nr:hypothetical protein C8Q76DRAFT_688043 [Earliella scabrosa]